ncbi:Rap1a/Tai family immunity protein [Vreelandella glaciei]|uniref:Rap1a/Tai family immunity protein n=1 Tax=Vreelandella glaciei TaxID=186761 RepID=UPI0030012550
MLFRIALPSLFIIAFLPGPAISFTGHELYESASYYQLERENKDLGPSYRSGLYIGYVKGIADVFGIQEKICTNGENSFGEVADSVASHLLENEWLKDLPPAISVSNAFMELYPCGK